MRSQTAPQRSSHPRESPRGGSRTGRHCPPPPTPPGPSFEHPMMHGPLLTFVGPRFHTTKVRRTLYQSRPRAIPPSGLLANLLRGRFSRLILTGAFLADAAAAVDNKLNVSGGVLSRFAVGPDRLTRFVLVVLTQSNPGRTGRQLTVEARPPADAEATRLQFEVPEAAVAEFPASPSSRSSCAFPSTAAGNSWPAPTPGRSRFRCWSPRCPNSWASRPPSVPSPAAHRGL